MNARQAKKKLKAKIAILESDNHLMREIIANVPAMQELYDAYNKPVFVTQSGMQFQEYIAKRIVPNSITDATGSVPTYITNAKEVFEYTKRAAAEDLLEEIEDSITYEVDTECLAPTITASIFVGRRE